VRAPRCLSVKDAAPGDGRTSPSLLVAASPPTTRRRKRPPAPSIDLWASAGPFFVFELADALRCSTRYVEKLIAAGTLPAVRLGRQLRIPASAARRLALEAGVEPANRANTAN
jgi:excisionase family DNA binding protein